jgi:hypothetical protein
MIAQATITDIWSLVGNTVVGAAVIVTQFLFLKALRAERAACDRDRAADREDRAAARREYTESLLTVVKESRCR